MICAFRFIGRIIVGIFIALRLHVTDIRTGCTGNRKVRNRTAGDFIGAHNIVFAEHAVFNTVFGVLAVVGNNAAHHNLPQSRIGSAGAVIEKCGVNNFQLRLH